MHPFYFQFFKMAEDVAVIMNGTFSKKNSDLNLMSSSSPRSLDTCIPTSKEASVLPDAECSVATNPELMANEGIDEAVREDVEIHTEIPKPLPTGYATTQDEDVFEIRIGAVNGDTNCDDTEISKPLHTGYATTPDTVEIRIGDINGDANEDVAKSHFSSVNPKAKSRDFPPADNTVIEIEGQTNRHFNSNIIINVTSDISAIVASDVPQFLNESDGENEINLKQSLAVSHSVPTGTSAQALTKPRAKSDSGQPQSAPANQRHRSDSIGRFTITPVSTKISLKTPPEASPIGAGLIAEGLPKGNSAEVVVHLNPDTHLNRNNSNIKSVNFADDDTISPSSSNVFFFDSDLSTEDSPFDFDNAGFSEENEEYTFDNPGYALDTPRLSPKRSMSVPSVSTWQKKSQTQIKRCSANLACLKNGAIFNQHRDR